VERNPEKRQERWLEFQQNKEDNVKERKQLKKRG
jgi:ATP-dependent clp protease ATP-binding subunit clpX